MANAQPTPSAPSGELKPTGTLEIKDSRTDKNYSVQVIQGGVEGDTATRATFLAEACAGDEELRREVASLIAYDSQPASFIESPALEVAAWSTVDRIILNTDEFITRE